MEPQTRATVRTSGRVAVIDIEGDLTSSAQQAMKQAYQQASAMATKKILLAFREEDYLNSAAISIIIDLITESRKREEKVRIAHPSAHFRKIFELVGVNLHAEVFSSAEAALKAF